MVITYKVFDKIDFPIYKIPGDNWSFSDGLTFLDGKILDDKNVKEESLGLRRLKSPFFKKMLPLKSMIDSYQGLIKSDVKTFIDNKGKVFIYQKTLDCKLEYLKIKEVERKGNISLVRVKGWEDVAFEVPQPPKPLMQYAGILMLKGFPWIIYDYSEKPKKSTWRKV